MPKVEKKDQQIKFLADRLAYVMAELVRRDLDYGDFCYDAFYTGKQSDEVRASKEYQTSIEFVRMMLRRQNDRA